MEIISKSIPIAITVCHKQVTGLAFFNWINIRQKKKELIQLQIHIQKHPSYEPSSIVAEVIQRERERDHRAMLDPGLSVYIR